jgi:hypothetical protein
LLCAAAVVAALTVRKVRRRTEELAEYEASFTRPDGGRSDPADAGSTQPAGKPG